MDYLREEAKGMPVYISGTVGDMKWVIKSFDNGKAVPGTKLLLIGDMERLTSYDQCMAFLDGVAFALKTEVNF